ncbi:hypothetical protein FXO37_27432 [Capsicum annuum]|nr:hypothetical protein FXO37_27432 [Capsicum annuum]
MKLSVIASLYRTDKLESLDEAREILKLSRDQALRIAPNLYHHLAFINVVEEGIVSGPRVGLIKEYKTFKVLIRLGTCKSLVHIFLSQRGTTKIPGVTDLGLVPRHVKKVSILGGGLMGSEIATVFLLSKYYVILKDVNDKVLEAGIDRIKANLQRHVNKGKFSQEKLVKALSLLKGTLDYETFRDVDMVIMIIHVPGYIMGGLLGLILEIPLYTSITIIKIPFTLFKGWYRLIHDLISCEGPFIKTACIPIAGLTILLWPIAVIGSFIMAILSSFFIGLYRDVIIYQKRSFQRGIAFVVAMVTEFDEYINDWLYLREGSILLKPHYQNNKGSRYCELETVDLSTKMGNMLPGSEGSAEIS